MQPDTQTRRFTRTGRASEPVDRADAQWKDERDSSVSRFLLIAVIGGAAAAVMTFTGAGPGLDPIAVAVAPHLHLHLPPGHFQ